MTHRRRSHALLTVAVEARPLGEETARAGELGVRRGGAVAQLLLEQRRVGHQREEHEHQHVHAVVAAQEARVCRAHLRTDRENARAL